MRALKLKGRRFFRLKVIEVAGHDKWGRITWACICACGNKTVVPGWALKFRGTRSCGCWQRDQSSRHGMTHTPEYTTYIGMHQRCECKTFNQYKNYGGRGIRVCKRWSGPNGFIHFFKDMGVRPPNRSIDRINVNGNYTPKNCRWATPEQQANNKRNSKPAVVIGELAVSVVDKSLAADKPPGGW